MNKGEEVLLQLTASKLIAVFLWRHIVGEICYTENPS
jgi:hypothetical protein